MTDSDDAVWIAAGGTRVEGSLATAARYEAPMLPGTEHVAPAVHAVPNTPRDQSPPGPAPDPIPQPPAPGPDPVPDPEPQPEPAGP